MADARLIDARELLDNSPWTLYQKLITLLVAFGIVVDGFDIQVLAFSIPSLSSEWHVARPVFAPVLALGLVGMALGGPFLGYLGDRFGRRPAMIVSILLFSGATLATAFIHSISMLAVFRFITGLGAGGAVPTATALAAEYAPISKRPVAVKLTILCIPLGGMLGGFLAARILPSWGWRALYCVGGCAPLVLTLLFLVLLPESPRFLTQSEIGFDRLAAFLRRAGHSIDPGARFKLPERTLDEKIGFHELFADGLASDTIALHIAYFFFLGSVYLIFGWLPTLLTTNGLTIAAASNGLANYNLGGVAGVLIWAALTSALGSRRPLVGGAVACALSALLVWLTPPVAGTALWSVIGLHGLLANAVQTTLYALAAHVYPTRVRALGVACAATLGRVGGIVSSLYGSALISKGAGGYWGTLAAAITIAAVGIAMVRRHIPAPAKS